jgi:hypothetical protein
MCTGDPMLQNKPYMAKLASYPKKLASSIDPCYSITWAWKTIDGNTPMTNKGTR